MQLSSTVKGSEAETKELLGGTTENNVSYDHRFALNDFLPIWPPNIRLFNASDPPSLHFVNVSKTDIFKL